MGSDRIIQLHKQYLRQSAWSQAIRKRFYSSLAIHQNFRVLEVGSGTGVITSEVSEVVGFPAVGLDVDPAVTDHAVEHDSFSRYLVGDGAQLPFPGGLFDAVVCHFLLLWTPSPERILEEMVRVTKAGGAIAALAEPDYDGRIDYPETLEILGVLQSHSLERRGADSFMGRRIRGIFSSAGLVDVVSGLLGGEWTSEVERENFQSEWATLHSDIAYELSEEELGKYREMDWEATLAQQRILFVPTFYAFGRVPGM